MDKKLKKGDYLDALLRSSKTVFTTRDIAMLWNEDNQEIITQRLHTYVSTGKLIRARRGIYVKDHEYDRIELATRIYTPSYISFETVLTLEGVNFQHYSMIFVASYLTRNIIIDNQKISYIRMKDVALSDNTGIVRQHNYSIASKERAILDRLYVSQEYHFDNLSGIDWDLVFHIVPIYKNKRLENTVESLYKQLKSIQ